MIKKNGECAVWTVRCLKCFFLTVRCSGFKRPKPPKEWYKRPVECSVSGFMGSFPGGASKNGNLNSPHLSPCTIFNITILTKNLGTVSKNITLKAVFPPPPPCNVRRLFLAVFIFRVIPVSINNGQWLD